MRKFVQEFKEFALRGSVVDLAVGIIIGGAFNSIVQSLVKDVVMPPISLLTGKVDIANKFISLNGQHFDTLAEAQKVGAPTLNYGSFLNAVLVFAIVAFAVFLIVKGINKLRRKEEAKPSSPTAKNCPFCFSSINIKATKCPNCTADITFGQ